MYHDASARYCGLMNRAMRLAAVMVIALPGGAWACTRSTSLTTALATAKEPTRHFVTDEFTVSVPVRWKQIAATSVPFEMWRFKGARGREMDVLYGQGEQTIGATVQHGLGNLLSRLRNPAVSAITIKTVAAGRQRADFTVVGIDTRTNTRVAQSILTFQDRNHDFFSALLRVQGAEPPTSRLNALLADLKLK